MLRVRRQLFGLASRQRRSGALVAWGRETVKDREREGFMNRQQTQEQTGAN